MKYRFITRNKKTWPVDLMCRLLGVKRNSYYGYAKRNKGRPDNPAHHEMISMVKDIAKSSDYTYGERRMQKALCALSFPVSRFKAKKLMDEAGVQVRHKKKCKVTTDSNHKKPVYPNRLKREFDVTQPNNVYASDICVRSCITLFGNRSRSPQSMNMWRSKLWISVLYQKYGGRVLGSGLMIIALLPCMDIHSHLSFYSLGS